MVRRPLGNTDVGLARTSAYIIISRNELFDVQGLHTLKLQIVRVKVGYMQWFRWATESHLPEAHLNIIECDAK